MATHKHKLLKVETPYLNNQWVVGGLEPRVEWMGLQRDTHEHEILLPGDSRHGGRPGVGELRCATQAEADEQLHPRSSSRDILGLDNLEKVGERSAKPGEDTPSRRAAFRKTWRF